MSATASDPAGNAGQAPDGKPGGKPAGSGAPGSAKDPATGSTKGSRARVAAKITPAMRQYLEFKAEHEDALLFFRMGDFYELFFEDAEVAAELLDLTLTSRNRNDEHPIPMCGIPHHALRPYVARLLEAGRKVAVCDQLELTGKGLARREVTRVISPGTNLDEETLAPERANYLAAVAEQAGTWGLAFTDFSTGEVRMAEMPSQARLEEELRTLAPAEVVLDAAAPERLCELVRAVLPACVVSGQEGPAGGRRGPAGAAAESAWQLLRGYAEATQGGRVAHLREPVHYDTEAYLRLDPSARRNLELLECYDGSTRRALVSVLDRSSTGMGRRLLRAWIVRPLADLAAIGSRLDAVEALVEDFGLRADLREDLRRIGDFERLVGRIGGGSATARDLVRLADGLDAVESLHDRLGGAAAALAAAAADLDGLPGLRETIRATLADEPAASLGKGSTVRDGFDEEVDRLRGISRDGKGWILAFEADERRRTGIPTLKVGFNRVFGYYIEVTRTHQALVPAEYVRKQTIANAERYITPELKTRENEVLGAEERLAARERHLLDQLLEQVQPRQGVLGRTAAALAALDAFGGLAETAHQRGLVRPEMHAGLDLEILGGRHPVVEDASGHSFVANDCVLSEESRLLMVLTGPNMAGKSTYLRQVALIVLLAHCGCFVPATSARIPLVDRIFTRIGASDNLAAGQSTFMVEMSETAAILRDMTERSLVVLDEIGRGTSTFDGISIAWAVAEAMVGRRVKTLFATHYHELAALEAEHDLAANFSVAVRRYKGSVIFLFRIVEGPTSGSYGIEVARLAGVPDAVIESARTILDKFESGEGLGAASAGQLSLFSRPSASAAGPQGSGNAAAREILERLAALSPETMTPLEALNLLARLVEEARTEQ